MDSDTEHTITDQQDIAWIVAQRRDVLAYLASQSLADPELSEEPRWFLNPYVALWAVRSKTHPDQIGWWAISGDLPTDYATAGEQRNISEVLQLFAFRWKTVAACMATGTPDPNYSVGTPKQAKSLAPLLLARAKTLEKFAADMKQQGRAKNQVPRPVP